MAFHRFVECLTKETFDQIARGQTPLEGHGAVPLPLVAGWFALADRFPSVPPNRVPGPSVLSAPKHPAAIYARKLPDIVDVEKVKGPLDVRGVVSFLPSHGTRRVAVQSGVFTVHGSPGEDWDSGAIVALLLKFDEKQWREATRRLLRFGMNRYALLCHGDR